MSSLVDDSTIRTIPSGSSLNTTVNQINVATVNVTTANITNANITVATVTTDIGVTGDVTLAGAIEASNFTGSSAGANTGDVTLGSVGSTPTSQGASLTGQVLTMQPADATHAGCMTAIAQTFGGNKTFNGSVTASNISGTFVGTFSGTSSGTNTGDITLGSVGSSPAAAGASLSGQVLTLQPADGTNPGVMTAGTQTFGGNKTFTGSVTASNFSGSVSGTFTGSSSGTNTGDITITDYGSSPNSKGASLSGQALTLQPADLTHPGIVTSGFQVFGGDKSFGGSIDAANFNGTLTGTNTGDVTLASVGSTPAAEGASLSSQVLTLQPANGSFPGVVTAIAQTFAGLKTFNDGVAGPSTTDALAVNNPLVTVANDTAESQDAGIFFKRYQAEGSTGLSTGDIMANGDAALYTGTVNSATTTSITFTNNFSLGTQSGYYDGWWIRIRSGTALNQVRQITSHTRTSATTGTFNFNTAFSPAPSASSVYTLYPGTYTGILWTEIEQTFKFGFYPKTIPPYGNTYYQDFQAARVQVGSISCTGNTSQIALSPLNGSFISYISGPALAQSTVFSLPETSTAACDFVVTTGNQTIAGTKTFSGTLALSETDSSGNGRIYINGTTFLHRYSSSGTKTNVFLGGAGNFTNSSTDNVILGGSSASSLTSGSGNTSAGYGAGSGLTSGSNNSFFGKNAGSAITTESGNIMIGNTGTVADVDTIRIGTSQTITYCAGVYGSTLSASPVVVNSSGRLGVSTSVVSSVGTVGSSPNSSGATITSNVLNLQPADGTNPGVITAGTQTIGGAKTFSGAISASNFSGSSSGTNTGDVTLGTVGSSPNSSGASLSSQVLTLQPADGTNPGVVTAGTQTIGGNKTLSGVTTCADDVNFSKDLFIEYGTADVGVIRRAIDGFRVFMVRSGDNFYMGTTSGNYTQTGLANYMIGSNSGGSLTSGDNNTSLGHNTGQAVTTGIRNTFGGSNAGGAVNSGSTNTFYGYNAGGSVTTGSGNIFIGPNAGSNITTTSNNLYIGHSGTVTDTGIILIGNSTSYNNGCGITGISGKTSTGGVAVLINGGHVLGTTTSSIRFKNTINDVGDDISAKLHLLNVKSFYYNKDEEKTWLNYGLIAEEVEPIFPELIKYEEGEIETIYYQFLPPLMLKEMQVQKKEIIALQENMSIQKAELDSQKAELDTQRLALSEQISELQLLKETIAAQLAEMNALKNEMLLMKKQIAY